ncbi:MAG: hypothetical protein R2695_22260 [Acidimicrobiales bacterium]
MRRFLLPVVVLAVAVAATVLAVHTDDAAPADPASPNSVPALVTPLLSARRAPEWLRQPIADRALADAATNVLAGLGDGDTSCLAVHRDGAVVTQTPPTSGQTPGALQRLVTLAAFDTTNSRGFVTEVVRRAGDPIVDGARG